MKTRSLTKIALMGALMCILGPLTLPLGIIPLSFLTLAIYLSLYVLGKKDGLISILLYLLLGLIGLPVFSGFTGGPARLVGPTGGFLLGYISLGLIAGHFIHEYQDRLLINILGMLAGLLSLYLLGSLWLSFQSGISLLSALSLGALPFIPGDILKILLASYLGPRLKRMVDSYRY